MRRELGIQCKTKHQYITTTNSKHNNKIYSNITVSFTFYVTIISYYTFYYLKINCLFPFS